MSCFGGSTTIGTAGTATTGAGDTDVSSTLASRIFWIDTETFDRRSYPVAASIASTLVRYACHFESMLLIFGVSMAMRRVLVVMRLRSLVPSVNTTATFQTCAGTVTCPLSIVV